MQERMTVSTDITPGSVVVSFQNIFKPGPLAPLFFKTASLEFFKLPFKSLFIGQII